MIADDATVLSVSRPGGRHLWDAVATAVARSACALPCPSGPWTTTLTWAADGSRAVAVFANDGYVGDERVRERVARLRRRLRAGGVVELGFGLSADGRAWALVAGARSGIVTALLSSAAYATVPPAAGRAGKLLGTLALSLLAIAFVAAAIRLAVRFSAHLLGSLWPAP